MGRVTDRVCVVTGAARGIGRAIGEALLAEGARVCFADLDADRAAEVAEATNAKLDGARGNAMAAGIDVREREQVREMIRRVVERFGRLDVVFNNARVNKPMNVLDVDEANWNFIVGVNGLGCLIGTQEAARDLAKHNITVTAFAPGVVATEMWEEVDRDLMAIGAAQRPGQAMEDFSADILRGRVARPDDITGTTTFLASRDGDYITGQIGMIDGGMTLA